MSSTRLPPPRRVRRREIDRDMFHHTAEERHGVGHGRMSGPACCTEDESEPNRRQLGALVGLVPAPYQSGESAHDQGITRAGNRHVRRVMVQLAWGWLRYQPDSALTQWYQRKFGSGSGRLRRIGIVALARKLLIALWHYVEHGDIPA